MVVSYAKGPFSTVRVDRRLYQHHCLGAASAWVWCKQLEEQCWSAVEVVLHQCACFCILETKNVTVGNLQINADPSDLYQDLMRPEVVCLLSTTPTSDVKKFL